MLIEYVRDKHRNRIGVVVAVSPTQIGWSSYNVKREKKRFDKEFGIYIAQCRAYKPNKERIPPRHIINILEKVSNRAMRYFKSDYIDDGCPF